jgi:hypothetical protein
MEEDVKTSKDLTKGTLYQITEEKNGTIRHMIGVFKGLKWVLRPNEDPVQVFIFRKVDAEHNEIPVPPEYNIDGIQSVDHEYIGADKYYHYVENLSTAEEVHEGVQQVSHGVQEMKLGGRKNKKTRNRRRKNKKTRKNKWRWRMN